MNASASAFPKGDHAPPGPSPATRNSLLARLSSFDLATLTEGAQQVHFEARRQLFDDGDDLETVYFPLGGLISLVIVLKKGPIIEAQTVGMEGFVGTMLLNDCGTTRYRGVCQVKGEFLTLPTTDFLPRIQSLPDAGRLLRRYSQYAADVVGQSAACNSIHTIEQRCARWLLHTADGVAAVEFDLTQEFLSQMLAVRRPGVNVAIRALVRRALISHSYGSIKILDPGGLALAACECYGTIVERASELL